MRVLPAGPNELRWLEERANWRLGPSAVGMAAVAGGLIRGVVGYDEFAEGSCCAHIAVESPIAWRRLIPAAFVFPFETLGLQRLLGAVASTNARSLRFVRHLGFREVRRLPDALAPGVDLVVHEMTREECRWLPRDERKAA